MTTINRKLQRKTAATRFSRGRKRPVIVVLEPPGTRIGFRLAKERKTYYLPVADLYGYAVRAWQQAEKDRKRAERKARKGTP